MTDLDPVRSGSGKDDRTVMGFSKWSAAMLHCRCIAMTIWTVLSHPAECSMESSCFLSGLLMVILVAVLRASGGTMMMVEL